jgi:adenosylcobinamide kinase/adenosylcobinamide-phosphate guanylyltransferase
MITFISGGARSGKSSFAENYALELFKRAGRKETLHYIATAERTDPEMENRIARHIVERESIWHTTEAPMEVAQELQAVKEQEVILLDCLTVWVNNMLYKGKTDIGMILEEVSKWIDLAEEKQLELIIVSNDVNEGIQSDNLFIHEYIYKLQKVHSLVTSKAESVYQVVAGIPIKWKG